VLNEGPPLSTTKVTLSNSPTDLITNSLTFAIILFMIGPRAKARSALLSSTAPIGEPGNSTVAVVSVESLIFAASTLLFYTASRTNIPPLKPSDFLATLNNAVFQKSLVHRGATRNRHRRLFLGQISRLSQMP
jgi:hypothetical protein